MLTESKILVFIHIPKAGGTTFNDILKREFKGKKILPLTYKEVKNFKTKYSFKLERTDLIKGHFQYGLHEYFNRDIQYITFLRDPVKRVISYYNFILHTPRHYLYNIVKSKEMSLLEFVNSDLTNEIDNCQTRYLSGCTKGINQLTIEDYNIAERNIENSICCGITERFDESILYFKNQLNWKSKLFYIRKNQARSKSSQFKISPEIIKIISKRNQYDIMLFEKANSILDIQISKISNFDQVLLQYRKENVKYTSLHDNFLFRAFRKKKNAIKNRIKSYIK